MIQSAAVNTRSLNIAIINPPAFHTIKEYPDESGAGFLEAADYGSFPPLGPLYVLSYAEKKHPEHRYFFVDCVGESLSYPQLRARLAEIQPDVAGLTSFTPALLDVIATADLVRAEVPRVHLCLGGHHAIAFPRESCLLPQFDSVIVGEGEYAFAALVDALSRGEARPNIPGLYVRGMMPPEQAALAPLQACQVANLDDLPMPNRRHIAHIAYKSIIGQEGNLATIITSRGCPYRCTFCDVPFKKYRQRSMSSIMDEIEACLKMGYSEFHFYDDLFNLTPKKVYDFLDALRDRQLRIAWDFRGRVNGVTRELLAACKAMGLRMITFGVETGSDEGLRQLKKDTSIAQITRVFAWCRELNILTVADFMIGLPHEKSVQDVRNNIRFLIALQPDYAQINILNLYPNTEIFEQAVERGLLPADRWQAFAQKPSPDFRVDHWTEWIPEKKLIQLHREAYRRFYFRPAYMLRRILKIRTFHEVRSGIAGLLKLLRALGA